MHALHVALNSLGARGHRAVDPGADLRPRAALHRAGKPRWNLEGQGDLARSHTSVQIGVIREGRLLDKISRAGQLQGVVIAESGLVAIEHRELEVLDIETDAQPMTDSRIKLPNSARAARTGSRCSSSASRWL